MLHPLVLQQQSKRLEQKQTLKVVYEAMHAAKREDVKLERKLKEENLQMVRARICLLRLRLFSEAILIS